MLLTLKKTFRSKFVHNTSTMLAGNIVAQAVAFLSAPIITRLYAPEDLGIMTYIWSLTGIISVGSCLCYQQAIILPSEEKKAVSLMKLSLLLATGISILLLLIFYIFNDYIAKIIEIPGAKEYILLVPLGVFVYAFRESFTQLHSRFKNFRLIAFSQTSISIITALVKIIPAALSGATAFWLIIGNIAGPLTAAFLLLYFYGRYIFEKKSTDTSNTLLVISREYKKFPQYSLPNVLLNSFSQNLPVILFAFFFSPQVVGFYGLARTILQKPVSLIASSLNSVFLQKIVELKKKESELKASLRTTTLALALLGIVPFSFIFFYGEKIFILFFGYKWATAGVYAQVLSPWMFLAFVNPPSNQVYIAFQRLRCKMYIETALLVCRFFSIVFGYYLYNSSLYAVILYSVVGFIFNFFIIVYAFAIVRKNTKSIII